jgi:tetratricopeptide (TPR) repeat protein
MILHKFAKQFDQDWKAAISTPWRQRYAYLQETKDKLRALDQKAQMQTLPEQEAWERAYYTLELQGGEAALPFLQDVLKIQPDHAEANYAIGQVFLHKADASGIAHIEKAIEQRVDWVIAGCELVYGFFCQQGQTEEAQKYRARAEQHYQLLLKAQQERATVGDYDRFQPHTLKALEVNELKQQLACYPQVKEAYLVEKVVRYFPENHFCVLGIVRKRDLIESSDAPHKLINLLVTNLQFPTQAYIIILNHGSSDKLKKKICQIHRSLIFRR